MCVSPKEKGDVLVRQAQEDDYIGARSWPTAGVSSIPRLKLKLG